MLYVPSPLVFAYLSGIYKACEEDRVRVTMITRTEDPLMKLECFFAASRDGRSKHSFWFAQFDWRQASLITLFPGGVMEDANKIGFCDAIRKSGFSPVQSILALKRSVEVDWSRLPDKYC